MIDELRWKSINRIMKMRGMSIKTYLKAGLTLDLFMKIHLYNHLSMWRVLVKKDLMGFIRPFQTKIDHHNLREICQCYRKVICVRTLWRQGWAMQTWWSWWWWLMLLNFWPMFLINFQKKKTKNSKKTMKTLKNAFLIYLHYF